MFDATISRVCMYSRILPATTLFNVYAGGNALYKRTQCIMSSSRHSSRTNFRNVNRVMKEWIEHTHIHSHTKTKNNQFFALEMSPMDKWPVFNVRYARVYAAL